MWFSDFPLSQLFAMTAATPKGAPQRIDAPEAYSKTPNCPAVPRKGP